jgi:hypothetical protein
MRRSPLPPLPLPFFGKRSGGGDKKEEDREDKMNDLEQDEDWLVEKSKEALKSASKLSWSSEMLASNAVAPLRKTAVAPFPVGNVWPSVTVKEPLLLNLDGHMPMDARYRANQMRQSSLYHGTSLHRGTSPPVQHAGLPSSSGGNSHPWHAATAAVVTQAARSVAIGPNFPMDSSTMAILYSRTPDSHSAQRRLHGLNLNPMENLQSPLRSIKNQLKSKPSSLVIRRKPWRNLILTWFPTTKIVFPKDIQHMNSGKSRRNQKLSKLFRRLRSMS